MGVVLAGGQSRRMQGPDKALLTLGGITLLDRAIANLAPQVGQVIVSANSAYEVDVPVVADCLEGGLGPLVGLLSAMEWADSAGQGFTHLVSISVDAPLVPVDLVPQLSAVFGPAVVVRSQGRTHPTIGMFAIDLAPSLRGYLESGGRKAGAWVQDMGAQVVEFDASDTDPFLNINTPKDLDHPALKFL